jgi:predicted transcriptional regulator
MIGDISTIPGLLGQRRADLGLTQHSVASLAGITQSYLSAVETGKVDARLSTLQDIARALRAELVLVPAEALAAVTSIIGQGSPPHERRLFNIEAD